MQSQSTSGINQGVFNPFSRRVDTAPARRRARHLTFIFNQKRKQISIEDRGTAATIRTTICSSIWPFQRTESRDSETRIREKKIVGSASGSISIRMKEMGGAIIDHLRSKSPTATKNKYAVATWQERNSVRPKLPWCRRRSGSSLPGSRVCEVDEARTDSRGCERNQ